MTLDALLLVILRFTRTEMHKKAMSGESKCSIMSGSKRSRVHVNTHYTLHSNEISQCPPPRLSISSRCFSPAIHQADKCSVLSLQIQPWPPFFSSYSLSKCGFAWRCWKDVFGANVCVCVCFKTYFYVNMCLCRYLCVAARPALPRTADASSHLSKVTLIQIV